jgi:hypothetical protein
VTAALICGVIAAMSGPAFADAHRSGFTNTTCLNGYPTAGQNARTRVSGSWKGTHKLSGWWIYSATALVDHARNCANTQDVKFKKIVVKQQFIIHGFGLNCSVSVDTGLTGSVSCTGSSGELKFTRTDICPNANACKPTWGDTHFYERSGMTFAGLEMQVTATVFNDRGESHEFGTRRF